MCLYIHTYIYIYTHTYIQTWLADATLLPVKGRRLRRQLRRPRRRRRERARGETVTILIYISRDVRIGNRHTVE